MNWYVHWYVLQKAHSVNKVATVSGPFCCLPAAGLLWQPQGPRHTILHWTLGGPPIPPSTQNISNHQQNSNSSLSHSSSCSLAQHLTDQQLWVDPSHPTKPFNLWMSIGNPSLWVKQINSRLKEIYKITRASESYPSATHGPQFSHVVYPTCCLSTATRAKANF